MRHALLIVALAVAVGVFHGFLKPPLDRQQVEDIAEQTRRATEWLGRYPPDFEVRTLGGESFALREHVGREVIVLNFFATWCGPCRSEMPELERFARGFEDRPFLLLGVDVGEVPDEVRRFVDEIGVSFPVALDSDGGVAESFQVDAYPTTVVIGAGGWVAHYEAGAILNADVALLDTVREELARVEQGRGISEEDYLERLARQEPLGDDRQRRPRLTGRAREIAAEMPCPCGCDDQVLDCRCQTASEIRSRLAETDLEGRVEAEVVYELNREFCVGAGGG